MRIQSRLKLLICKLTHTHTNGQLTCVLRLALREHPDVVVATPSRLVEHLKANNIAIKALQFLVVDEADLILSYGSV